MRFVRLQKPHYLAHLREFRSKYPELAWGLADNPEGTAYLLPEFSALFCVHSPAPGIAEITGMFRMNHGGESGAAYQAVQVCRALGYTNVQLDCFAYVADVWARAGLRVTALVPFNADHAPSGWLPEYGTPSVMYMRTDFKEPIKCPHLLRA